MHFSNTYIRLPAIFKRQLLKMISERCQKVAHFDLKENTNKRKLKFIKQLHIYDNRKLFNLKEANLFERIIQVCHFFHLSFSFSLLSNPWEMKDRHLLAQNKKRARKLTLRLMVGGEILWKISTSIDRAPLTHCFLPSTR